MVISKLAEDVARGVYAHDAAFFQNDLNAMCGLERQVLIYWLLRAYQSGHREGWEAGPSTDETMDGICSVLANRGYDPNLSEAAKQLLKTTPCY